MVRVTQLVPEFLSGRIVLYVAVDPVCLWEGVSSGPSYVAILNQNLQLNFLSV